ncbi:ssl1498 family light-harvesting-like protein [Spirulina sp. CS-785/01]|uniref:photosystem II assembly protein Psb34 n=1 Tax=Spirulina sp. CS-785/01 TaxID=3021716 RepID=UPI00232FAB81|nr:ssl1498 family light-harvesting-like protein [Spirulina sp. CS-785/01]MDB9312361.1 ssl1498 family light-harvesting-like protein [Spirulina sp. CS-785/01]
MYTTVNTEGQLNNYANEPSMYWAEYPDQQQQQRYAKQGAFAVLLVTSLLLTAFAVS